MKISVLVTITVQLNYLFKQSIPNYLYIYIYIYVI